MLLGTALSIITKAIKAVPSVRYAFGVAGIAAAGYIVNLFLGTNWVIVVGSMLLAMILLFVFSMMVSSKSQSARRGGDVLIWVVVLSFAAIPALSISYVVTGHPERIQSVLGLPRRADVIDAQSKWAEVLSCVGKVHEWLVKEDFKPAIVIGEEGGTLILSELLLQSFYEDPARRPPFYVVYGLEPGSVDDKYDSEAAKFVAASTNWRYFIPKPMEKEDKDKKVLIFEDWAVTGKTINGMKACLQKMGFQRLRTAVMATIKRNMTYLPDYVCSDVEVPQDKIPWTLATAPLASIEEPSSFECTVISK